MNQTVSDGMFLGHLPKQMLITDMFTEFSHEDHLSCPFASAYEQVRGMPFFKGRSTPLTLVYNDENDFVLAESTLKVVSDMTGYGIVKSSDEIGVKSILHAKVNADDYAEVCKVLSSLVKSDRSVLEITNFKNIEYLSFVALSTLIEQKLVDGVKVNGLAIVLQESRNEKINENEYARKLRSLTMTINEQ
ncbi:hypothetical protein GCM10011607_28380 [Shewanella inventionis]|uniref:Uncharacterized protein n=1 Tax=Shewanella inventionis TaxID=1738770 RepID=A0ABQ1JD88_9GAMM|nr:hypothetical protein [Shewanella inventionis]GGB66002.1 hypothetical protein GCM10011607_28380 [Shewanella inventionis]